MVVSGDLELIDKLAVKGPEDFRRQIIALINRIKLRNVGRALLDCPPRHKVIIMPDPSGMTCNGSVPVHPAPSKKCKSITTVAPIEFTPGCRHQMWPDDDILVHELVHAVRKSLGLRDCRKLPPGLRRFDDREEFYAILVANIYTSEKQNKSLGDLAPMLRRDHRDGRMHPAMARAFLEDAGVVELVEAFMLSMEDLTKKIVRVRTAFNPIREVYEAARAFVAGF